MSNTTSDIQKTTELKPCFCGRIPQIETLDVGPQEDGFFIGKTITFVMCECGQCLFDVAFLEGFVDECAAATAWNYRAAPKDNPEGAAAPELVEALRGALEAWRDADTPALYDEAARKRDAALIQGARLDRVRGI